MKLGVFSPWNGHRPLWLMPAFFSSTERPTTSTMSRRETRSWMKLVGITTAVYGGPAASLKGKGLPKQPHSQPGRVFDSDGEIRQLLARRHRGFQPIGLQAAAGPGFPAFR